VEDQPNWQWATMTAAQRQVYDAICTLWQREGFGPSLREIAVEAHLASTSTVALHVAALARLKVVAWKPGKARSIRVIGS
jgi:SOS-response transcriptional repressor LexA